MSSIESYSCFRFHSLARSRSSRETKASSTQFLRHNRNGKYVKIHWRIKESLNVETRDGGEEEGRRSFPAKDFIIYDTLMLQLDAHKINDTRLVHPHAECS